jgi:NADP-dependent 3-hydroxy acid dehydrogenase YdfG
VINIASIGALGVSPTAAVYCATKYAVRAISDGLRQEHDNIRVLWSGRRAGLQSNKELTKPP